MNTLVRIFLVLLFAGLLNSDVMAQRGGRGQSGQGNGNNQSTQSSQRKKGAGQQSGDSQEQTGRRQGQNMRRLGSDGLLTATERSELILMREEEKLARDVYIAMSKKWDANIFSNIAGAESRHMQAVEGLLSTYQIPDPIVNKTPGVFSAPKFQQLYTSLVKSGSASLVAAMKVGLKIEEMDIADLRVTIQSTDNKDIKRVLQHLEQGSMNHLRAFAAQLNRLGESYVPTHLSQSDFDQIARSSAGRGSNQGQGRGQGRGGQQRGRGLGKRKGNKG